MTTLLLSLPKVLQPAHSGLGLLKMSCKKGINIPIETMENKMLNRLKKKYKTILPLKAPRYLKILEYLFMLLVNHVNGAK